MHSAPSGPNAGNTFSVEAGAADHSIALKLKAMGVSQLFSRPGDSRDGWIPSYLWARRRERDGDELRPGQVQANDGPVPLTELRKRQA